MQISVQQDYKANEQYPGVVYAIEPDEGQYGPSLKWLIWDDDNERTMVVFTPQAATKRNIANFSPVFHRFFYFERLMIRNEQGRTSICLRIFDQLFKIGLGEGKHLRREEAAHLVILAANILVCEGIKGLRDLIHKGADEQIILRWAVNTPRGARHHIHRHAGGKHGDLLVQLGIFEPLCNDHGGKHHH